MSHTQRPPELSVTELLDDPLVTILMQRDGVDRAALEQNLLDVASARRQRSDEDSA